MPKKSKEQKALDSGVKSLDSELKRYQDYLEHKIDFKGIEEHLKQLGINLEDDIRLKVADKNNQQLNQLKLLIEFLEKGERDKYISAMFENEKLRKGGFLRGAASFEKKYGYTFPNLINKENSSILRKLYDINQLRESLKAATLDTGFQKFRKTYDEVKLDLTTHDKKERSFLAKIGHAFKKAILIPHTMYSKGNFAFWKSRAELLGGELEKAREKLEHASASKTKRKGVVEFEGDDFKIDHKPSRGGKH